MSVVGNTELQRRLKMAPGDPASLVVAPIVSPDQIGVDCIDVHLGNYFIGTRRHALEVYDITKPVEEHQELMHVPFGEDLVLPAGESLLGMVYEYLKLPADLSAEVLTRSSYGRLFITVATATWIHPGFLGCLTLEILNGSRVPVRLVPGMRMAQLVFYDVRGPEGTSRRPSNLSARVSPHFPDFSKEASRLERLRKGK